MKYGPSNPVPQSVKDEAIARAKRGEDLNNIAADIGIARWTVAVWCRDKMIVKACNIANIASMPLVRLEAD